jgi:hypothetical protein
MSPVHVVEDFKSDLIKEFPNGRGMVSKERILELLDYEMREEEYDDSLVLLHQSIADDDKGFFTFREILTKIIGVQRDGLDEGDVV